MKTGISRFLLLTIGIILTFSFFIKPAERQNGSYYDSGKNMKVTRSEIQQDLIASHSASYSSKYKGTATVKTTYLSSIMLGRNISQGEIVETWNSRNAGRELDGVCGLVSLTMLFRTYMEDNLLHMDTAYGVFSKLAEYAWSRGVFNENDTSGTTTSEEKKIANGYLTAHHKKKYLANVDSINLWSTLKDYLDDKEEPVTLSLNGKAQNHSVMATGCYIETVTYKQKNVLGWYTTKTDDYKIVRICNGWEDSNTAQWNRTTHRYIYFDCVLNLLKLK
ncbi:MAG: hypothetical protein Q4C48_11780 [Lachnospiraceae bacterium]|nr:hypothetical protein [Lachnospiraceae bacterium]